ncbi:hypothetical protein CAMRE0001_2201 [Campylobacter rectus RM3267]|uniref:Uncharacterized protein n=1 Tax=Campylobacter rectus RM3267 TaxID=553218 RepID=B9D648_CAMRE|nr:hypothetical protein CAMRE0001_2201 [Campylobacter rectus RM3267]
MAKSSKIWRYKRTNRRRRSKKPYRIFMNLPYKFKSALFNLSSCKGAVSYENYVLEK